MSLTQYMFKKINTEMRIIYITESKPKKQIKLDPIDPLDLAIDLQQVTKWSENNRQLYNLLINNGLAQFLCNRQFLFQFYKHLQFMYCSLNTIDIDSIKLSKLKVLNLFKNNIKVIQNIPLLCTQLYLDFNNIQNVKLKNQTKIQLLSLSHNYIDDKIFQKIIKKTPHLRCLNVAYNRLESIIKFVQLVKKCQKLKILIARNNPFSLLALYYEYITAEIQFDYFDNQKYVKIQPIVQKPEIKQQKKQQKKDEKKDAKKDTKKGGKVQQKPVQQQKKVQVKIQVPKVKTQQDYKQARLKIQINVLQNVTGTIYDSSIFPQDNLNIKKTQSCFWVAAQLLDKKITTEQNKISMDSIVPDGQINRINFQLQFNQTFQTTYDNLLKLKNGLTVSVYKQQPIVQTDPESGQQKVLLDDKKQIKMKVQCIGGTFVDLESLCALKKKQILKNYNLFKQQAVSQPLFKKPYENEGELISKHRVQFDSHLAALEQQKRKKQQEQQASKAQKKGGKDTKKAPAKKQAKKDSKQPVAQKKVVQKCTYPQDPQQYRYLGEQKMYKCLKQHLGIKVIIL